MGLRNERGIRTRAKRRFGGNRRHGDEMASVTEKVLSSLQERQIIADYVRDRTAAESGGGDYTVSMLVDGRVMTRRFGVSISRREWQRTHSKRDDFAQFCFPLGTRPETIRRRILGLFPT